ncbi:permease [uncultured Mailhella sp.]|uniref:permease n=1 Tax=uncultured Mailhella sp. TaxID=1981031 RepID=UPI0025E53550|nr:permease [uncultured Mailhella sp.]
MLALCRRYRMFLILFGINIALVFLEPAVGRTAFALTGDNVLEMLSFLPPIFVLLGLLDVWVDRETMMKYMGRGSGARGMLLAFILGSAAAGPLYVAFPMTGVMLKKGASLFNVFIFIGAWSTTKIPLIMFESATLGFRFMALRLAFNLAGIFLIAFILEKETRRHPVSLPGQQS